jgi:VanZ family protein
LKVSLAWLGVIAFSSTALAGRWAEDTFDYLASAVSVIIPLRQSGLYHVFAYGAEKSVHVTMFFVLALLLWNAVPERFRNPLAITVAGTLIGVGSELLQLLFPGRDPAIRDVLINGTTTAIGACLASYFYRRQSLNGSPLAAELERSQPAANQSLG